MTVFQDGLQVQGSQSQLTIMLDATSNKIVDLSKGTKTTILLGASDASLELGSSGTDGRIALRDAKGKKKVRVAAKDASIDVGGNGADGQVRLLGPTGATRVNLSATDAFAILGGDGKSGFVTVLPAKGAPAANVLDLGGVTMDGKGRVWVGGKDDHGLIMLFAKEHSPVNGASDAAIVLDAGTGDIILRNADCAEEFEVVADAALAPGTVVVLNDDGRIRECNAAYDGRVAGVVSGAGGLAPGIVLGRVATAAARAAVALAGKVFCWVDADIAPVRAGDLLTTSDTPGHAMRAADRGRAFGAVVGKALASADGGRVLLPMLVTLQ